MNRREALGGLVASLAGVLGLRKAMPTPDAIEPAVFVGYNTIPADETTGGIWCEYTTESNSNTYTLNITRAENGDQIVYVNGVRQ